MDFFSKDYIGKRLHTAKNLVNSALIVLKNEGASAELINSLAELDIDSLFSVDVKSTQLMMHEEMGILRAAVENGDLKAVTSVTSGGGEDSAASKEAINKLETENNNLRSLLKELKEELLATAASKDQSDIAAKEAKVSAASKNQSEADAKISALTEQLNGLQVTSSDQESQLKRVQGELDASTAAFKALEVEHEALKASQSSLKQGSAGECKQLPVCFSS